MLATRARLLEEVAATAASSLAVRMALGRSDGHVVAVAGISSPRLAVFRSWLDLNELPNASLLYYDVGSQHAEWRQFIAGPTLGVAKLYVITFAFT